MMAVKIHEAHIKAEYGASAGHEDWLTGRVDAVVGQFDKAWRGLDLVITDPANALRIRQLAEALGELKGLLGWTPDPVEIEIQESERW